MIEANHAQTKRINKFKIFCHGTTAYLIQIMTLNRINQKQMGEDDWR